MEKEFLQAKKTCVNIKKNNKKMAKVIPWKIRSAKAIDVWFGNAAQGFQKGQTSSTNLQ